MTSLLLRSIVVTVVTSILALSSQGQQFRRFLVPFFSGPTAGAHGSVWVNETWLLYRGDSIAGTIPRANCYAIQCTLEGLIDPGRSPIPVMPLTGFEGSGLLFHVEQPHAALTGFASRVGDVSRVADTAGTEVPIVPEERLRHAPLHLVNIPITSGARVTLRVFALPDVDHGEVEVRYYRLADPSGTGFEDNIVERRREHVSLHDFNPSHDQIRLRPLAATLGSIETFPELRNDEAIWMEIIPITPELRIWALASVTNNTTQQVTLITPLQQ